ncbi:TPA: DUF916 and DUF3324 domain-containing protein [Enterococcus faecalis]|uniref:DUF916 and DUF3324 domain-containing protein n=1 Tax=Enterococcus TaxID=1350 RepID=UPI001011C92C|nr:DUF916 and DUF3324 domain-containing protein [Enterococcus faecalis]EHG5966410.1 DUF916 and DUF3324 domain-containing protein [Enterococcus faecalis]EHO3023690.1 DUF916 and DUF3324 domain-containing protein [Enterococcus faecalis]EHV2903913.1 DUF916 and DUF3324 domain-containing protein [Enterococcus faecalis]EJE4062456.1 DUF916 and DUF3324 domain-containing protein [Enterococcus faecalis]EKJ3562464.1 DUF916 and DUF3324 domain-containing protein [Enterococcus faecalis]
MKNIVKILFSLVALVFIIVMGEQDTFASGVDYSIQVNPSAHQKNKDVSYFDLQLEPNSEDNLMVTVKNISNHEITIDTYVDKTTTNSNGVVEYKNSKNFKNINLVNDITQIIKPDVTKVELNPGEEKQVKFKVTMPEKAFSGVVAGGLNFVQQPMEEKSTSKSSMAVKNQYAYTIAVVLNGDKEITKNDVSLGEISADQINGRNSIKIPIENASPGFLNKVIVDAKVFSKGSKKVVYSDKKENGQIAPNSVYNYELSTKDKEFAPGEYTAQVTIVSKEQKWSFNKAFKIDKKESKSLNKKAVAPKKSMKNIYIIIAVILLMVILVLVGFYMNNNAKKNEKIRQLNRKLERNKTEEE